MAARAHQGFRFFLGARHPIRAARLHVDRQAGRARGVVLHPRLDGNVDVIVLRLAQHRADRLSDSHDFVGAPVDIEFLADGIDAGEKFIGDVRSDQRDERAVLIVGVRDVAARGGPFGFHVADISGHAIDGRVFYGLAVGLGAAEEVGLRAHALGQLRVVTQENVVVPGQRFVPPRGLHEFFHVRDDRIPQNQEYVRPEIGNAIGHVQVHAGDQRHDHDQRGNGQHDSQQHQKRAHFVRAQRFQRNANRFTKMMEPGFHALRATPHYFTCVTPEEVTSVGNVFYSSTELRSVCVKSWPLKRRGSLIALARAYAKQSPKFNRAGCPLPFPKSL